MKMKIFLLGLWITIFILVACGSKQEASEQTSAQSNTTPKEHIFSTQENALRKAQQLNQTIAEHDKDMRKKLEEATE